MLCIGIQEHCELIRDNIKMFSEIDDAEHYVSYTELVTSKYLSDLTLCISKYLWNVSCSDCFNVVHKPIFQKNYSAENMRFWELLSIGL